MLIPMRSLKDRHIAQAEAELAAEELKQKEKSKKKAEVVEPLKLKDNKLNKKKYGK